VVSIYPYVNSVVAVALGWLFFESRSARASSRPARHLRRRRISEMQSGKAALARMKWKRSENHHRAHSASKA